MNRERRKKIREITGKITACAEELTSIKEDEDYARENTPENLQGADAYSESERCSDKIDDAITDLQQAVSNLDEI
ncbi:MAG: hypothetical protein ACI4M6_05825 [Christensenellaceae bacterium]